MPKMPDVTVHVTTEPDPKELSEFKVSAAMWEEQCRTLQRTLIDAKVEQDNLRDCAAKFGTELILAKARVAELEAVLAAAQARIKVLEMQAPGYAELERERIIALIEDMMRTSVVIREGDTGVWLVLSDLLRDIRNPK